MPRRLSAPRSGCPISLALELLGDPWTLLVVRDLMFKGRHTFAALLAGGEGIASNILADRLLRLNRAGVLIKTPSPSDRRRYVYQLTEKGIALAPLLVELVLWSAAHDRTEAPEQELRAMRDRESFLRDIETRLRAQLPTTSTSRTRKRRARRR